MLQQAHGPYLRFLQILYPLIQLDVLDHRRKAPIPRPKALVPLLPRHLLLIILLLTIRILPLRILDMKNRLPRPDKRQKRLNIIKLHRLLIHRKLHHAHHLADHITRILQPTTQPPRMRLPRQPVHVLDGVLAREPQVPGLLGVVEAVDVVRVDAVEALGGREVEPRAHHRPHARVARVEPALALPVGHFAPEGRRREERCVRAPELVRPRGEVGDYLAVARVEGLDCGYGGVAEGGGLADG